MSDLDKRTRLETQAIVIGYAMSRLDVDYLALRSVRTWGAAYQEAAAALDVKENSFKNLRDEFDPLHVNPRKGWRRRDLRPDRQRVLSELANISDDALAELTSRILAGDGEAINEAIDSMAVVTGIAHNVAERLLTGRRAEEYFLHHSLNIVGVSSEELTDTRFDACGYDFGLVTMKDRVFEIKGIKKRHGGIQFTDREWLEAKRRTLAYWLVVIGNLEKEPQPLVIQNPYEALNAQPFYATSVAVNWRATIEL